MEWIQIPIDNVLLSEHTTKELMTLIKYQALYCQLEKEPNEIQLRKLFKQKDIVFIQNYTQTLNKMCENQIKKVTKKRNRDKVYYSKNKDLEIIQSTDSLAESKLSASADKIRLDKTKEYIMVENIKFSPVNKDFIDDTLKFRDLLLGNDVYLGKANYDKWASSLRLLKSDVGDKQYYYALDWYARNIDDKYTPVCNSAITFREKWVQIVNMIKRSDKNGTK